MASGWTNRGAAMIGSISFTDETEPTNFFVSLVTDATAPSADIDTFTELHEIAAGNGYFTGGQTVARNETDFDVMNEDDTNNRMQVQIKDIVWTADGGNLPSSGDGARYAILLDDNAVVADRQVLAYFDLTSNRSVSDGQTLTLQDIELRLSPA